MSVSPEEPPTWSAAAPGDLDAPAAPVGPAPRTRRRVARAATVAAVATGTLSLAAAAVAGVLPVDRVVDALARVASPRPAPTPVVTSDPAADRAGAALDDAERALDEGRLDGAADSLVSARGLLLALPAADRDASLLERYDALRARLLSAVETAGDGRGATPGGSADLRRDGAHPDPRGTTKPKAEQKSEQMRDQKVDEKTDGKGSRADEKTDVKESRPDGKREPGGAAEDAGAAPTSAVPSPSGAQSSSEASAKPRA